jgi:chromosome segregation ATPase
LNSDISGPLLELQSLMDFLGLKDKKREKILAHIDCLIQDKSLQKLKAKHNEIILNVNILEKELSENSLEITELEAISERTSQQIERLEASIEQNNRNLSALEEKVLADKTELKVMVERIACKPMVIDLEE